MVISEAPTIRRTINTARYPLFDPDSPLWHSTVAGARRELAASGCCVLSDFVHPGLRKTLRDEGVSIAPAAHYAVETVNAYNIAVDTELAEGHPARTTFQRGNAFVARDLIPPGQIIQELYTDAAFQRFVAACFGLPRVHVLADPLSGLCLNVVRPGMEHPWHFDTNEFTVSLLTQQARAGGVFEYCPNIRSAERENFADVAAVLAGRGGRLIRRLTLRPGDLQLFKGRYSLHRVTAVEGDVDRHTAIFAYSERPGVVGSVARTRQLFGRVLPDHLDAEAGRVRGDALLD